MIWIEKKKRDKMKEKTCCFTGHRAIPPAEMECVSVRLREAVREHIERGYRYFGAGGAIGFDTLAAETVLSLKEEFPEIALILVLPCENQTKNWRKEDVLRYESIKSRADKCVYTADVYTAGCMQKRNRHLVDNSSSCIAYLRMGNGGTAYTVRYAEKKGVPITLL